MSMFVQSRKSNSNLLILLFLCSIVVYTTYNKIGLWVIMPFLFICTIIKNGQLNNRNCYPYYVILLLSFLSCIFAVYKTIALNSLFTIVTGFLGFFIFFSLSRNVKNIRWLFAVYIGYYVGMWLYVTFVLGITNVDISLERVGGENVKLNANDVAYMTFYFNSALWMLYVLSRGIHENKILNILLFICMALVSFISAILFASRQILVIELPFILGLLYIKYFYIKGRRNVSNIVTSIFLVFLVFLLYQQLGKEILLDSLLFKRYESVDEDGRFFLMQKALEVGISHPILGVGCGNFMPYAKISAFSHCSYTELFANSGVIAFLVYIIWILKAFFVQFKRYKTTKNVLFLYLALIIAAWFFSNFFYVYYTSVWLMGFWGLVLGTSNALYYCREINN